MPHPDYQGAFGNDDFHFERDETREQIEQAREAWIEDQWANGIESEQANDDSRS